MSLIEIKEIIPIPSSLIPQSEPIAIINRDSEGNLIVVSHNINQVMNISIPEDLESAHDRLYEYLDKKRGNPINIISFVIESPHKTLGYTFISKKDSKTIWIINPL